MYRSRVSELDLGTRDQTDRGERVTLSDGKQCLRKTGLPVVGEMPWGSHFRIFYETKKDLRDILVPFFKAGLEANEFCLAYIRSHEFLTVKDAKDAFRKELADHETTKNFLQIPYDRPVPEDLIRKIAEYRLRNVREREDDAFW